MNIEETIRRLVRDGFILVFNQDRLDVVKTAEALMRAGIENMEVTCRIQNPLGKIARLRNELSDFVTGAASLIDSPPMLRLYNRTHPQDPLPSLQQAVEAGADFLVSAVNFSDAAFEKYAGTLALIPGCGSATEVVRQFSKGANLCKLFPAKQLGGPAFVKAIDPAIHKTISLVPTGGTNAGNIPDYISSGILVLGGSFSMIDRSILAKIIDRQDYDLLTEQLKKTKAMIDEVRSQTWPQLDFNQASLEQITEVTGRNFNINRR